jgi:hypothetical protein
MSIRSHVSSPDLLNGFRLNVVLDESYSDICRANSIFVPVGPTGILVCMQLNSNLVFSVSLVVQNITTLYKMTILYLGRFSKW